MEGRKEKKRRISKRIPPASLDAWEELGGGSITAANGPLCIGFPAFCFLVLAV